MINSAPFEISQNFSNDKNVKILLYYKNTKRPTVVDIPVRVDRYDTIVLCYIVYVLDRSKITPILMLD